MSSSWDWVGLFLGSVVGFSLAWVLLYFNGSVLAALWDRFMGGMPQATESADSVQASQGQTSIGLSQTASASTFLLLGLCPFALAALLLSAVQACWDSRMVLAAIEGLVLIGFGILPRSLRRSLDFSGQRLLRQHRSGLLLVLLWCLVFSSWMYLSLSPGGFAGGEYLLVNRNPDLWAYTRRFAALTTTNLSFDGHPACDYFLTSPKKMSSLLGSLFVAFSPTPAFGILMFQSVLGSGLFLLLFWEWRLLFKGLGIRAQITQQTSSEMSPPSIFGGSLLTAGGSLLGLAWALSSPQVFWMMVSAYLSNTLFILVLFLALRSLRAAACSVFAGTVPGAKNSTLELKLVCLSLIVCVSAFYPVGLAIALFVFFIAGAIYSSQQQWRSRLKQQAVLWLWAGGAIALLYVCFSAQFSLSEVQSTSNPFLKHGSNFVPLNPWSLLQEKPKPMGLQKDFGVWFHVVVGLLFTGFGLRLLGRQLRQNPTNLQGQRSDGQIVLETALERGRAEIRRRDLWAGQAGLLFYGIYLSAYFFLDYTYRLGKIAISILWPLAVLALLPTILWIYRRWKNRFPRFAPGLALSLLLLHVILHGEKVGYLQSRLVGQYPTSTSLPQDVEQVIITRCPNMRSSQYYERLVGLRLARQYPTVVIEVNGTILDPEAHSAEETLEATIIASPNASERSNWREGKTLRLMGQDLNKEPSFDGMQGCRYSLF